MTRNILAKFSGKKVLLLQGPMGHFFRRLARDLRAAGAEVHKINFCGGDLFFYPFSSTCYRGRMKDWPTYFIRFVREHEIDAVFLYGDCRPIHRPAMKSGIDTYVFEEGYVRPDYITFEKHGVNGHSRLPRNPDFYRVNVSAEKPETRSIGNTWPALARQATLYYLFSFLLLPLFHRYVHHRTLSILEGLHWLRSFGRKMKYAFIERNVIKRLVGYSAKNYYLIPLQVFNDAQISVHSRFYSVRMFLRFCLNSFARCAPPGTLLVIKHHPMDRAYSDYAEFLRRLSHRLGIEDRVIYVHDLHLPMLLQHARGAVVVNSTVGLSSLHHGTPLKICGKAIYDMEGLAYQGSLDDFWRDADTTAVDRDLYLRFLNYAISTTQLNGSFYKPLRDIKNRAGIILERVHLAHGNVIQLQERMLKEETLLRRPQRQIREKTRGA